MVATPRKKKLRKCSLEVCLSRTEIPEQVQSELVDIGGVEGLCDRLPDDVKIRQECDVHHALSEPVRLKILYLLHIQPLCVCVIKACTGIADSKLSYHFAALKKAGLIEGYQQGNYIIYSITEEGQKHLIKISSNI
jgi:DNA-binding transcriptional ArsR family regulator